MVRGMKVLLSFVAFLLCLGVKKSNADWVGSKRKFISISNKAKDEAVIQCKSEKQSLNKTLKAGEKIRWGLVRETICEVDVGSKGVQGYLPAFVDKECKRECKWRVLDDGVLKLKGADGEWKSFELKADEEAAARNYDEHHPCDDDDDDDDDDVDVGKGKRGSSESRSLEPAVAPSPDEGKRNSPKSMPIPMSEKRKSRKRGARLAPSPNEGKSAMSKKKKSGKWMVENAKMKHKSNAQSAAAPHTTKRVVKKAQAPKKHGGRKLKPRHPRSPAAAKTHTPKSWRDAQGMPTSSNYFSPTKFTKKAAPPMKQGRRKFKPRHPRSPAPENNKNRSVESTTSKSTLPPPTEQLKQVPENAKTYTRDQSRPRNSPAPAPAPALIWRAPPPIKQIKKAKKQGGRKLKPTHPRAEEPVQASAPTPAPAPIAISPTNETMKPSETSTQPHHGKSPKRKAPAPADWRTKSAPPPTKQSPPSVKLAPAPTGGGEESDAELSPLPPPGSTFYTCIKE